MAEERDRNDFNQQFMMCKGLSNSEAQVKISLFGDLAGVMESLREDRSI